jgi:hypothetical protein
VCLARRDAFPSSADIQSLVNRCNIVALFNYNKCLKAYTSHPPPLINRPSTPFPTTPHTPLPLLDHITFFSLLSCHPKSTLLISSSLRNHGPPQVHGYADLHGLQWRPHLQPQCLSASRHIGPASLARLPLDRPACAFRSRTDSRAVCLPHRIPVSGR